MYVRKDSDDIGASTSDTPHNQAFEELVKDIKPRLEEGRAFSMNDLLNKYQNILQNHVTEEEAMRFTSQKLKQKLELNVVALYLFYRRLGGNLI